MSGLITKASRLAEVLNEGLHDSSHTRFDAIVQYSTAVTGISQYFVKNSCRTK